ncbi:hypothetical protein N7465_011192 [Penicillium sp. CMV-2018d]|nr:hypothetical protein N7465_011192 [Penicillium sp. CMV-2018d]
MAFSFFLENVTGVTPGLCYDLQYRSSRDFPFSHSLGAYSTSTEYPRLNRLELIIPKILVSNNSSFQKVHILSGTLSTSVHYLFTPTRQ